MVYRDFVRFRFLSDYHIFIGNQILDKETDYFSAFNQNNKGLYAPIRNWMQSRKESFDINQQQDFGSGRIERRVCFMTQNLTFLEELSQCNSVSPVIMIETEQEKNEIIIRETRDFFSSKKADTHSFSKDIRNP